MYSGAKKNMYMSKIHVFVRPERKIRKFRRSGEARAGDPEKSVILEACATIRDNPDISGENGSRPALIRNFWAIFRKFSPDINPQIWGVWRRPPPQLPGVLVRRACLSAPTRAPNPLVDWPSIIFEIQQLPNLNVLRDISPRRRVAAHHCSSVSSPSASSATRSVCSFHPLNHLRRFLAGMTSRDNSL